MRVTLIRREDWKIGITVPTTDEYDIRVHIAGRYAGSVADGSIVKNGSVYELIIADNSKIPTGIQPVTITGYSPTAGKTRYADAWVEVVANDPSIVYPPRNTPYDVTLDAGTVTKVYVGAVEYENTPPPGDIDTQLDPTSERPVQNKAIFAGLLTKQPKTLYYTNKAVLTSDFTADTTYEDYLYKADIPCVGAVAGMYPNVVFAPKDADSGNYSTVATTGNGYVRIYAVKVPTSTITILSIKLEMP